MRVYRFMVLLAVSTSVQCQWWMDQPYENSEVFNTAAEYGSNTTLECEDEFVRDKNYQVLYWVRPDLTVMMEGERDEFETLDGTAAWEVNHNGSMMEITLVQERQFGWYHCVLEDSVSTYTVKKALNFKGPTFGDLWPKYRMNTIVGCSASGVFLVLCIVGIVVYECIFADDSEVVPHENSLDMFLVAEEIEKKELEVTPEGYQNTGFAAEETEKINGSAYQVNEIKEDTTPL